MSHNVGAIYVRHKPRLTLARVVAAVDAHFTGHGARRSDRGAKSLEPLSREDTERLGVAVIDAAHQWFTIVDSEGYTASSALAAALANKFDTDVVHYEVSGASESASITRFDKNGAHSLEGLALADGSTLALPDEPDEWKSPGGVEDALAAIGAPYVFERFEDVVGAKKSKRVVTFMGFSGVSDDAYEGSDESDESDESDGESAPVATAPLTDAERATFDRAEAILDRVLRTPMVAPDSVRWLYASLYREEVADRSLDLSELSQWFAALTHPRWHWAGERAPQYSRAIPLLRRVLQWTDGEPPLAGDARTWLMLALAYARTGSADEAKKALRACCSISPVATDLDEAAHVFAALGLDPEAHLARKLSAFAWGSGDRPKRLSAKETQPLVAFVRAWVALPEDLSRCSSDTLDAHRFVADSLGLSDDHARIEAAIAARSNAIAAILAAQDEGSLAALAPSLPRGLSHKEARALESRAIALGASNPALCSALSRVSLRENTGFVRYALSADVARRARCDDLLPLAALAASSYRELTYTLARYHASVAQNDAALSWLALAKRRAVVEVAFSVREPLLAEVIAMPEARAIFEEPVSFTEHGAEQLGEVHSMLFTWMGPMKTVGARMAPLVEWYLQRFGDRLAFGNTSANKAGWSALDKAMLTRARNALTGPAAGKGLVAVELRDTDGSSCAKRSVGWLGSQDKDERCALWMSVPVGALGDGDAFASAFVELCALSHDAHSAWADVALSFDMGGVNAYSSSSILALYLHSGVDLLADDVAMRIDDEEGVAGARFLVALCDKLLKKCPLVVGLPAIRAGALTVLRGSAQPERGSLLRPDEPWMRDRRALAEALEPITAFDLTPYEMERWSRRWLRS